MKYDALIDEYINDGLEARRAIPKEAVEKAVHEIAKAMRNGKKLIVFGNGGSAADAQHIVGEFIGLYTNPIDERRRQREFNPEPKHRIPLSAIALTSNISNITAIANDYSFDEIFKRQLEGLGHQGDVAMGITTSGNSKNILAAINTAKQLGIYTIGLTGGTGGKLKDIVDDAIVINSSKTSIIQEAHLTVCHLISILVERELFD